MSTQVQTAVGRFVWHDHASEDPAKAKDVYTSLFGWETEVFKPGEVVGWTTADMDMGDMTYTMFRTGDADRAGCMPMMPGVPAPFWLSYIGTDDVDATAAKAKELGGTIHVEPRDIPNVGRFAVVG